MQNITVDVEIQLWTEFMAKILSEDSLPQMFLSSIMLLIFVVGFVGNMLTCIVVYYDSTMHTATNYYLFDLAVSDLLVSFAMLLEVHDSLGTDYQLYNSYGDMTCRIHFFLVVALWNNGVLIMTALAAERYVAICHPLALKSSAVWRRVSKVIIILWIVAMAETLPEIWTVKLIRSKKASMCFIVPTRFAKIVNGVLAVVTFIVPLAIMAYMYAMIAIQMNVVQKRNSKCRTFNHRNNRGKVNKLITLTLSYLVCWVPLFSMRVSIFVWDTRTLMELDQWWIIWYKVTALNNWFSGVLNPLLFSVMSTKFRKSLKKLWNQKFKKQRSSNPELYTSRIAAHHV